jgi:hypothetical protein
MAKMWCLGLRIPLYAANPMVLRGRRQVVTALSDPHSSACLVKSPTFGFGVEKMAGGSWQTKVRLVPEVNE